MAFEGAARATCRGGPPVVPNNTILVRDDCAATGRCASADARITPAGIFNVSRLDKDMDAPSRYTRCRVAHKGDDIQHYNILPAHVEFNVPDIPMLLTERLS